MSRSRGPIQIKSRLGETLRRTQAMDVLSPLEEEEDPEPATVLDPPPEEAVAPPLSLPPSSPPSATPREPFTAKRGPGTFAEPYVKKDGTKMQKWALSVPLEFYHELRRFSSTLPLDYGLNTWVVEVLRREMRTPRGVKT